MDVEDYARASPATALTPAQVALLDPVGSGAADLCRAAQAILVLPDLAFAAGVPPDRAGERNMRRADDILRLALELDDAALTTPRRMAARVIGTCRHFAVVSCAFLRARGIPARVRCGFETYFQPGRNQDHWITEYFENDRWIRIDSEVLGFDIVEHPEDLAPGRFLTGPEAWLAYRAGADPMSFGVYGTENWGAAEIVGNAIRDLAALHKVETLPWDEWGPMAACYADGVTAEVEVLMDELAAAAIADEAKALTALYEKLPVPAELTGEITGAV